MPHASFGGKGHLLPLTWKTQALWSHLCQMAERRFFDEALSVKEQALMLQEQKCSSIGALCLEIHSAARLPSMPPLHQAHHIHSMKMSSYMALSAVCTYSCSSKGPKRGKLTPCSQDSPWCPPLGIWVPWQGLPSGVCPQTQHQNTSSSIFHMTWADTLQLSTDLASFLGEETSDEQSNTQHLPVP